MNDYNIACFLAFCKTLDLDIAAMQLEISRASVINNISRVEKALGVSLVDYDAAAPALTYAGTRFFEFFSEFERELTETQAVFSAGTREETLTVIWSEYVASPPWLTQAVDEFIAQHPHVEVLTRQGSPAETIELLENAQADVAICSRYLMRASTARCHAAVLGELPFYLIAAADGPYAKLDAADFAHYGIPLIATRARESDREAIARRLAQMCARAGFRPRQYLIADNLDSVYLSVRYGNGFAATPLNAKVRSAGVFRYFPLPVSLTLTATRLRNNTRPIVEEFEAFLTERSANAT